MGKIIKEVKFDHNRQEYCIRVETDSDSVRIRSYLGSRPVNRFTYSVTWETAMNSKDILGLSAIETLIELAMNDVTQEKS